MKNKKILLINDNPPEAGLIREILDEMGARPDVYIVDNGRKALHVLMGSPQNGIASTNKMRPDIILLDRELPDMTALEFLGIMRKYYSLQDIKIFILEEVGEKHDQSLSEKFSITGFLQRPFENNATTRENFKALESELNGTSSAMAFPFFLIPKLKSSLSLFKKNSAAGKLKALQTGSSVGMKITACLAGMSIITATAIYCENIDDKTPDNNLAHHTAYLNLVSGKANSSFSDSGEINSTHAGLYILESGELDLKSDQTLTFFSASRSGKPCYKSEGYWKLENDSIIAATFFRDSATVRYRILSDNTIAPQEISDQYNAGSKKICPIASPSLLLRIKGYYPDGNVEWALVNKWIRDHVTQKLWGSCVYYFPTGEISSKGRFKNGLREGRWRYFDRSGKKIKTEFYKKGLIVRTKNPETI